MTIEPVGEVRANVFTASRLVAANDEFPPSPQPARQAQLAEVIDLSLRRQQSEKSAIAMPAIGSAREGLLLKLVREME